MCWPSTPTPACAGSSFNASSVAVGAHLAVVRSVVHECDLRQIPREAQRASHEQCLGRRHAVHRGQARTPQSPEQGIVVGEQSLIEPVEKRSAMSRFSPLRQRSYLRSERRSPGSAPSASAASMICASDAQSRNPRFTPCPASGWTACARIADQGKARQNVVLRVHATQRKMSTLAHRLDATEDTVHCRFDAAAEFLLHLGYEPDSFIGCRGPDD